MNQVELPSKNITKHYSEQAGIHYYLKRSNRKNGEIALLPNQDIKITVPLNVPLEAIELILLTRKYLIKLIKKPQNYLFGVQPSEEFFISDTYYFLGKEYRLKLLSGDAGIEIISEIEENRYITIYTRNTNKEFSSKVFNKWLRDQAKVIFEELFEECWSRFSKITGYTNKPDLVVRKLKRNWGTMSRSGIMTLNSKLMQTTMRSIKYVINRELCHLVHMNHPQEFNLLLGRINPGWELGKIKLYQTFSD